MPETTEPAIGEKIEGEEQKKVSASKQSDVPTDHFLEQFKHPALVGWTAPKIEYAPATEPEYYE